MSERLFPAVLVAVLVVGVLTGVYGLVSVRRVEASIGLVLCAVPLVLLWGSLPSDVLGSDTADPGVESVAFGVVDGRTVLASGSWDETVRLWDPATGKQIGEPLTGHKKSVESVAFGVVDGRTVLASGGEDKTVRLWDPATGKQIGEPLTGHKKPVESVAFGTVDGRTVLASGGDDKTVRLWDPATGKQIGEPLTGHDEWVESVAFGTVDGRTVLASGSWDETVRLWDPATGKQIGRPLSFRNHWVNSVAFGTVDGRTVLASGGDNGKVRLWDPATGKQIGEPLTGHDESVQSVAFGMVDGRTVLAAGGYDETVRLWDPATGKTDRRTVDRAADGAVGGVRDGGRSHGAGLRRLGRPGATVGPRHGEADPPADRGELVLLNLTQSPCSVPPTAAGEPASSTEVVQSPEWHCCIERSQLRDAAGAPCCQADTCRGSAFMSANAAPAS